MIKENRMGIRLIQRFFAVSVALVLGMGVGDQVAYAVDSPQPPLMRLDAPVTLTNSVLFDFGYGQILRVPKILFPPSIIPKDPHQPLKAQMLSMTFQFPDMVQGGYSSGMDTIFDMQAGRHVRNPDRFPVNIVWMFYSDEEMANLPWERRAEIPFLDVRPTRMFRNQVQGISDFAQYEHRSFVPPTIVDSKYKGLREVHFAILDQAYYDKQVKLAKERGVNWEAAQRTTYIEGVGSPYELLMECDHPSSLKCQAYVYSKSSHFQYRMIFPPEAVAHADELIRTINRMVDGWIQK
ncbi:hypothetical protein [Collimonas fungivorans]|uniref:hypothetical protein n=1 Tax=Collimonas fungivorans TaxID=158899 RepID=UPI0005A1D553|nr:hypothetical protein [Collimonas fungivorans]